MPSLRELQQAFAEAVLAPAGTPPAFAITGPAGASDGVEPGRIAADAEPADAADRVGIYRNAVFANYRNALRASLPVVLRLVGEPFFHAAVDAFVRAHPSVSGDLNVYGDLFGDFLAGYPHAADLPYLADVARLEWAVDEAQRAADVLPAPDQVLAALAATAPERLPALRVRLDPSCRLVASEFPVLHIWQVNQPRGVDQPRRTYQPRRVDDDPASPEEDDNRVSLDEGGDLLVVRRGSEGVTLERVGAGEHAFLAALAAQTPLGVALDLALQVDAAFDLGAALRSNIGNGTITTVA